MDTEIKIGLEIEKVTQWADQRSRQSTHIEPQLHKLSFIVH